VKPLSRGGTQPPLYVSMALACDQCHATKQSLRIERIAHSNANRHRQSSPGGSHDADIAPDKFN
jgi:hypothetical protein